MKISEFFKTDYVDFASYDNYRKIASICDGFKVTSRKIFHTVAKNNITSPIKVSILGPKCSIECEYLHGESSIFSVIVNMAQNFVGTNNVPILTRKGSFGTRFNTEAAAPRYIKTFKEPIMNYIFRKEDTAILVGQNFEGTDIEPKFFLPIIPMILVNGAQGVSPGFAQKILPRDPEIVLKTILNKLQGKKIPSKFLIPSYKGFKGKISIEDGTICIDGIWEKENNTTIKINELPIGYDLAKYEKILQSLEDNNIISGYDDYSDPKTDNFDFIVKVKKDFFTKYKTDEKVLEVLKLRTRDVENFTLNSEDNKIIELKGVVEVLEYFFNLRLEWYQKRKTYLIEKCQNDLKILLSKYIFVKKVYNDELILNKRTQKQIDNDLDQIHNIIKIEDSYQYLMRMPINSITKEKYQELLKQLNGMKEYLNEIKSKTPEQMWESDLQELMHKLKEMK